MEWIYTELSKIKGVGGKPLIDYLHEKDGSHISDIDPFSVFAIFNRATSSRSTFLEAFKTKFNVSEPVPTDFDGIPVVDARRSFFFSWESDNKERIETIWTLFEKALHEEDFSKEFNYLISQQGISYGITMCLFWIRPYTYISLDSRNRDYLSTIGLKITSMPSYEAYSSLVKQIKQEMADGAIPYNDFPELSFNVWQGNTENRKFNQDSTQMTNKHQTYIDLLKANYNIIFNGAPGTGKTYLAKEIAEAMGAKYKMVQFHPSYDYTDFVEGLRPVKDDNGNIGFERKDGVFKEFCRKALIVSETSSNENLFSDLNDNPTVWKVSLGGTGDNPIRTDCLENGWIRIGWHTYGNVEDFNDFEDFNVGGKVILRAFQHTMQIGDIVLSCFSEKEIDAIGIVVGDYEYHNNGNDYPRYRKVKWLVKGIQEDIRSMNRNKVMTLSTIYKLPIKVKDIVDIVNRHTTPNTTHSNNKKFDSPFVFIIDEINRGEISKIFGELFFSIDPGYRGTKGLVQTQYQNLVEEGDVFKDGFYVPENVYIIGTMNDIDRSVESMDFAMRRRFAWQEITAEESAENMGITGELRERMDSLNKVIIETEGLGSSYQVGGAMFKKVKDTEENVEGNCGMTADSLWNLNLKSLMKEYLRGLPEADDALQKMEDAYFLKKKAGETGTKETSEKE